MQLIEPTVKYKEQYLQALEEGKIDEGDTRLNAPREDQSFEDFIQELLDQAKGLRLPKGYVPGTTFWLVDDNDFIGRVSIRHQLNDYLLKEGGHIGYYIRPSKRRMGYGRKILELGLIEAKKLGLSKVLITCDEDNIGSNKIIQTNGGKLENKVVVKEGKPAKMRYWISID